MKSAWCVLFLVGCASGPPIDGKSAYAGGEPISTGWLRSAVKPDELSFHDVTDSGKLPANTRGDMLYWEEKLFAPAAVPLSQHESIISTHDATNDTPDLVRVRYSIGKLELTVIESVNVALVFVRGVKVAGYPEAERPAIIANVAAQILNMKGGNHDWQFGPPQHGGRPGTDGNFSTDPSVDPSTMQSWEQRADGGVMGGVLYFFLYKKNPNRAGYENAQSWFRKSASPMADNPE